MAEDTDFAALYRELGINATCSLAELRGAWRRRVAKLHPDQGGSAEDTGRLQQLNRLYDAALDFHARYERMPGATASGSLTAEPPGASSQDRSLTADIHRNEFPASGFGRISRYFVMVSLVAIAVLGWRVVENAPEYDRNRAAGGVAAADTISDSRKQPAPNVSKPLVATLAIAPGMGKDTVRDILGEPLDMHVLRWSYGPSWVEFRCGKVVDWYSSPLRPLRVSPARDARIDTAPTNDDRNHDRDCD
jgi:hypothetical protein